MSVLGQLSTNQLTIGRISIDWMKAQGIQITILAGLTDTRTGKTRAWVDGTGIVWSERTARAMNALRSAMEEDIAAEHFFGGAQASEGETRGPVVTSGLGEYFEAFDEPPSV